MTSDQPMIDVDDICPHDLIRATCTACKLAPNRGGPRVWMSGGGSSYHTRRDCEALREGQEKVLEAGGTPAPVVQESLAKAESERNLCKVCGRGSPSGAQLAR